MTTEDGWRSVLECNGVVWNRLLCWELLLFQLADARYRCDKKFIAIVQFACQLFERDVNTSFTIEEGGLYSHVEDEIPRLRGLVKELRTEHAALRKHLEMIHWEFDDEASFDRPEVLRACVAELAQALRAHMKREEEELVPALLSPPKPSARVAPSRVGPYALTAEDDRRPRPLSPGARLGGKDVA